MADFAEEWRKIVLSENPLDYALSYAERGWKIFPVWQPALPAAKCRVTGEVYSGRCSCSTALQCSSVGKHPITARGLLEATSDKRKIAAWWQAYANANIGLSAGASGFAILDVDTQEGVDLWRRVKRRFRIPDTPAVVTGAGGRHFYFRGRVGAGVRKLRGCDFRGEGSYVLAPGSLHESGRRYQWVNGLSPDSVEFAPWPHAFDEPEDWMVPVERTRKQPPPTCRVPANSNNEASDIIARNGPFSEGQRNDSLYRVACGLLLDGIDPTTVEEAVLGINQQRCTPALSEREVLHILASAKKGR